MKRLLLLLTAVLFIGGTAFAKNDDHGKRKGHKKHYKMQPIVFVEKGVKFSILPNGDFRFRKVNYKHNKFYANKWNKRKHVRVVRDRYGRIMRVGRVPIYYKRNGKIAQIGNVRLRYAHGNLVSVGDLYLEYKHNGKVKYFGEVKPDRYGTYKNRGVYYDERPYLIR
ncbi:MAG TPA: hypothetical protein VJ970_05645 [Flavobacteriaceae bacterium]|nr:hypothetical protein [Flavobacteriaceae bacterium]